MIGIMELDTASRYLELESAKFTGMAQAASFGVLSRFGASWFGLLLGFPAWEHCFVSFWFVVT